MENKLKERFEAIAIERGIYFGTHEGVDRESVLDAMHEAYCKGVTDAAESAKLIYHEGVSKINKRITYFQSGVDNIQVDKSSILELLPNPPQS